MITKVYTYGARQPIQGYAELREQMRLAIRYRRRLLELERLRWERLQQCESEHNAEIATLKVQLEEVEKDLESRPKATTREEREEVKKLREKRKSIYAPLKEKRKVVRESHAAAEEELQRLMEEWLEKNKTKDGKPRTDPPGKGLARQAALDAMLDDEQWPVYWRERQRISRDHNQATRDARASSQLHHGTYTAVEDAVARATDDARKLGEPPHGGWVETVKVGTQCQDGDVRNRLEIEPLSPAPENEGRNQRRKRSRTLARVRIGSHEDGSPLWCELPIKLHRPLPDGGRVLWAYVVTRRIGFQTRYELQVTVQCDNTPAPAIRHDAVAVSIGWVKRKDGSVLAGCWRGTDGKSGKIIVEPNVLSRLDQAKALHGIADLKFEEAREIYCSIRRTLSEDEQKLAEHAGKWRSHRKLQAAIRRAIGDIWLESWRSWRRQRLSAKLDLMPTMEEARAWCPTSPEHWYLYCWCKKDEHLTQWERVLSRHARLHRREGFRVEAKRLASRYATLALAGSDKTKSGLADLRPFARQDRPMLDGNKGVRAAEHDDRSLRVEVAPGELRESLLLAFGGDVSPVPGEQERECSPALASLLLREWSSAAQSATAAE